MSATTTPPVSERTVSVWDDQIDLRVKTAGVGSPVLYLHPAAGLHWDPLLSHLSERHQVLAPELPGTSAGDPHAIHKIDDVHDLVLIYQEAITKLGLDQAPVLIGQSFGGMLAAELAAHWPELASKLVLMHPIGLWREDEPVANWMAAAPDELPRLLFADPAGSAAQAMFTLPDDQDQAVAIQAAMIWTMGCTGKFVWPIPERGLAKRLHRISTPTLILWGREDRLVPVSYAQHFASAIATSRVETIAGCGHVPQLEQTAETLRIVDEFLGG